MVDIIVVSCIVTENRVIVAWRKQIQQEYIMMMMMLFDAEIKYGILKSLDMLHRVQMWIISELSKYGRWKPHDRIIFLK